MSAKNKLEELLMNAVLNIGARRVQYLQAIRQYLQKTDPAVLNDELSQITNIQELRMLLAAGVPSSIMTRFYVQYNKALHEAA